MRKIYSYKSGKESPSPRARVESDTYQARDYPGISRLQSTLPNRGGVDHVTTKDEIYNVDPDDLKPYILKMGIKKEEGN